MTEVDPVIGAVARIVGLVCWIAFWWWSARHFLRMGKPGFLAHFWAYFWSTNAAMSVAILIINFSGFSLVYALICGWIGWVIRKRAQEHMAQQE